MKTILRILRWRGCLLMCLASVLAAPVQANAAAASSGAATVGAASSGAVAASAATASTTSLGAATASAVTVDAASSDADGRGADDRGADDRGADDRDTDRLDAWETQSVRELLHRDLNEALQASAGGIGPAPVSAAPAAVLGPRLVALYGVGQTLMAEVQVGQRAYLYVRGQAWPAGHQGDAGVYQLRGMNGACVQLEREDDRHSLCLRMLLGGAP